MSTLGTILKDNWEWRAQIGRLAIFDLKKQARGTALGWVWLILRPLVFIGVFWFALEVGLRAGASTTEYPYFIWLISGLIPWFYMQDMISKGSDVLHRYTYLVNKVKFPLSGISTLYALSRLVIHAALVVIMLAIYTAYGMAWDIYLLQIPLVMILMFVFWDFASIWMSQLAGISRDFGQLMKVLSQPFFWLSGVIYSVDRLTATGFDWVQTVLLFNPVTFFVTAMRDATCHKIWIWEDPAFFGAFAFMLVATVLLATVIYKRFHEEVADVL